MVSRMLVVLLSILSALGALAAEVPAPVASVLRDRGLAAADFSAFAQAVDASDPLLAINAEIPRNPASAIKVLTTYAALEMLGPAYQWQTRVYLGGPVRDGVLNGGLILRGSGDPFLVTEYFWRLLRGLRDRGIRQISGDLVLDNSYFSLPPLDPGAFDGESRRAYNALPDALLLNFQTVRFVFFPEAGGIRVFAEPSPANLTLDNRLRAVGGRCQGRHRRIGMQVSRAGGTTTVVFSGDYPRACGESDLYRVVMPNQDLVHGVFRDLWEDLGGTLAGSAVGGRASGEPFYTQPSRPLAELIRGMNKFSNNVMTRQLLLTVGAEQLGAPATLGKGRQAVADWLGRKNLEFPELVLDNGAGLSRRTRISARSLGQLLLAAERSPYRAELISSLPIAAVDGTLRRRFRNEPLARQMHIKTGTLDDVRAMAGFLRTRSGKHLVVVSLHNAPGVDQGIGTEVQNALLRWLFEH